jgi:O-antigen ligase
MKYKFTENSYSTLLHSIFIVCIVGLFLSRSMLSIGCIGLVLVALINCKQIQLNTVFFISIFLSITIPFITSFYSNNFQNSMAHFVVKLPLLAILMQQNKPIKGLHTNKLVSILAIAIFVSAIATLVNYYTHYNLINTAYLQAKVMQSPLDNDHIRYSWLVAISFVLVYSTIQKISNKLYKKVGIVYCVFSAIFLHILAAKTGLLCLYIFMIIQLFYLSHKYKILLLLGCAMVLVFSYLLLPSFKNRINYIRYDYQQYSNNNFIEGLSDGARVLSIKAGIDICYQNPIWGCGFGNLSQQIDKWHNLHHSSSKEYERFLPTCQFLIYAAASGILGFICFVVAIFSILKNIVISNKQFGIGFALVLLIPLITDDTFEGQFGIAIFVLGVLLFAKSSTRN